MWVICSSEGLWVTCSCEDLPLPKRRSSYLLFEGNEVCLVTKIVCMADRIVIFVDSSFACPISVAIMQEHRTRLCLLDASITLGLIVDL